MTSKKITVIQILLYTCLIGLAPLSETIYTPALPEFVKIFHISNTQAKYSVIIYIFAFAISQIFYGFCISKYELKKLLTLGLSIYIFGVLIILFSSSFSEILIGRLFQGLGASAGSTLIRIIMKEKYTLQECKKYFPIILGMVGLLPVLGPTIGGLIINSYDWKYIFILLLILAVIILVIEHLKIPNIKPNIRENNPINLRYFLPSLVFMSYVVMGGILLAVILLYSIESPFFIIQQLHYNPLKFGLISLSTAICYLIGTIISSKILSSRELKTIKKIGVTISFIGCIILLLLSVYHPLSLSILIPPMLLIMLGIGITKSNTSIGAMYAHHQNSGQASSLIGFWQMLMSGVVVYIAVHFTNINLTMLSIVFIILLTIASSLMFYHPTKHD